MKNIIILLMAIITFNTMASDCPAKNETKTRCTVVEEKETEHEESSKEFTQKVRVITKWKTKVVYKDRIVYKERSPRVVYKTKVVYKDKPAKIKYLRPKTKIITKRKTYVKYPLRNSISLMGFAQRTKLDINETETEYSVKREHELDLGLMFQRDLTRRLRFSVGGNLDGTGFVGLGFNL